MKRNVLFLLVIVVAQVSIAVSQDIRVVGTDTLILLGQRWSQGFRVRQPQVSIRVEGGGLVPGLKALASGQAQIVQSDKDLPSSQEVRIPVGVQGIAVYVNRGNPVAELTISQLRAIFLGQITNWKDLGGPNKRIALYAGDNNTDTETYFQDAILKGEEPYPYVGLTSAKELVETVARHPEAIGYSSIYSSSQSQVSLDAKVLRIKATETSPAVEASIETIRQRQYPISRYIYWYLGSKPSNRVKNFCAWALSNEGQLVVESIGFEPLPSAERSASMRKIDAGVMVGSAR